MSNLDHVINGIYCLSQETASTIINLRAYQNIAHNADSLQLYILCQELRANCLETYKDMKLDLFEKNLDVKLEEISAKSSVIEKSYNAFMNTISLPFDHILVKKLALQVNCILSMSTKLSQILARAKSVNNRNFVMQ